MPNFSASAWAIIEKSTNSSRSPAMPVTHSSSMSILFFGVSLVWWSIAGLWCPSWSEGIQRRSVSRSGAASTPNSENTRR